ncbi:MAG: RNA-binding protein [Chthonomonas sp.]|nr:RNA-binding protein [Chthonomonas sp.]
MLALNFYSEIYEDILHKGRKTATIRLGDKSDKYRAGEIIWITVGPRYGTKRKLYTGVIDRVEVKPIMELSPRDIERENPEFRNQDDVIGLLGRVYQEFVTPAHTVTVVYFSKIEEGSASDWKL